MTFCSEIMSNVQKTVQVLERVSWVWNLLEVCLRSDTEPEVCRLSTQLGIGEGTASSV